MTGRANPEPDALVQIMDVSEFHMLAAQELSPTRIWAEWSAVLKQCDPANLALKLRSAAPKNFPIIVTASVEIEAKLLGTNVDIYGGSAEKARVISAPAS